jgi:hypothetical protein
MALSAGVVANDFIVLVKTYDWSKGAEPYSEDKAQVLYRLLSAAGLNPKEVVPGRAHFSEWNICEELVIVNHLCPFKVIDQNGEDDYAATKWLDSMVGFVASFDPDPALRECLMEEVCAKIASAAPFEVYITAEGDVLLEQPPTADFTLHHGFVRHTCDTDLMRSATATVGRHKYCGASMDRRHATAKHDALVCLKCGRLATFPAGVKIYGDLRRYFVEKAKKEEWA